MKPIEKIRRENLKRAIDDRFGGSQTEAAKLLLGKDKKPTQINHWLGGKKNMSGPSARKVEKVFGLTDYWMDADHSSDESALPNTGQTDDLIKRLLPEGKGNVVVWERPEDLEHDEDRVWIDRYDYHFSAGSGLIQWEVRQKKALPFDIGFFRALRSNPKDCRLLTVRGDSMEPFLFNRDMFMIDVAKTRIRDGGIYAVYFEDEALVKQLFKKPGGALILHSYNSTKYPDREILTDQLEYVKVVGEFIYRSGSGPAGGN